MTSSEPPCHDYETDIPFQTTFGIQGKIPITLPRVITQSSSEFYDCDIRNLKNDILTFLNERPHLKNLSDDNLDEILNTNNCSLTLTGFTISHNDKLYCKLNEEEKNIIYNISICKCPNSNIPNWQNLVFQWYDGGQLYFFKPIGIWIVFWGDLCPIPENLKFNNWEQSFIYYDLDGCDPIEERFFPLKIFKFNSNSILLNDKDIEKFIKH